MEPKSKVKNKNCFSYSKKNGGSCQCLKDELADCHGCKFFKDKADPVNNERMKPFYEREKMTKWQRFCESST